MTSQAGIDPWAAQRFFEDVQLGDEFEEAQQATSERVHAFMAVSRFRSSGAEPRDDRFRSTEEARREGLEGAIVPGQMSAAMLTRLVADWMGPFGRIVSVDVSFRRPVIHDHHLRCLAVVTDVDDAPPETGTPGIVRLDIHLENEAGERPVQGTAVVELPRRSAR